MFFALNSPTPRISRGTCSTRSESSAPIPLALMQSCRTCRQWVVLEAIQVRGSAWRRVAVRKVRTASIPRAAVWKSLSAI
eukprot:5930984-Pyramimonas_sp.AAC.1